MRLFFLVHVTLAMLVFFMCCHMLTILASVLRLLFDTYLEGPCLDGSALVSPWFYLGYT